MKILRITESQYKRLVRKKNLNEQIYKKQIIYTDEKDEKDVHPKMNEILDYLSLFMAMSYMKPLYIKKVESGVVYIDNSKYGQEEKEGLKKEMEYVLNSTTDPKDEMLTSDFGFDSGLDADYDWGQEDVADIEDDDEVADVEDDDEVADIEDGDEVIAFTVPITSDQRDGKFLKNQKNESVDPKYIYNFLIGKGLKDYQVCGILGCMYYEGYHGGTSFNTGVLGDYDEDKGGYTSMGICQWHNERFENLINYSIEKNKSVTNKDLQLDFMWDELNGRYYNKKVLKPIKNSDDISEATFIWACKYEICEGCCNKNSTSFSKRLKKAEEYFELYSGEEVVVDLDCEYCITTELNKKHDEHINDENVKDFRWWVNQDGSRLEQVTDKFKECCETKSDTTLSISSNEKNDWTVLAFSVVGNEWINTEPKPKKPQTIYKNKNGNLSDNELMQIMNDVEGHVEYLSKESAPQFNRMVEDAKKEGVIIKISDAYRPCGEPGDYQRYLNGARFTQWAAREAELKGGDDAANPNPSMPEEWIRQGGGYCTSNHGWGNAIDIKGSDAKKWVRKNGEKYGWYWGEAKNEDWHFTYCGANAKHKSSFCRKK